MKVIEILQKQREALKASIAEVEQEIRDIDIAIDAVFAAQKQKPASDTEPAKSEEGQPSPHNTSGYKHPMKVNDAIVKAVEAGQQTPMAILGYLRDELNVNTTIGSVRARLSPLGKNGSIARDETGWIPASGNRSGH